MSTSIHPFHIPLSRRKLLHSLLLTTGGIITGDLYAEALTLTPRATEGPYYPDHLPLDQDNDLLRIKDGATAEGVISGPPQWVSVAVTRVMEAWSGACPPNMATEAHTVVTTASTRKMPKKISARIPAL